MKRTKKTQGGFLAFRAHLKAAHMLFFFDFIEFIATAEIVNCGLFLSQILTLTIKWLKYSSSLRKMFEIYLFIKKSGPIKDFFFLFADLIVSHKVKRASETSYQTVMDSRVIIIIF